MSRRKQASELELYSPRLGFIVDKEPASLTDAESLLRVSSVADLERLVKRRKLHLLPARRSPIIVELPWLPPDERAHWSRVFTKNYYQCGCRHGAAFLLMGSILLLLRLILYGVRPLGIWYLLVAPLFLFLLSGAGKASGILWSRIQFRRSVSQLLDIHHDEGAVASEVPDCRS